MPQSVLIVTDSEPLSVLLRKRLAGEPVVLATASGVVSAMQLLRDAPIDAALLDADLPDSGAVQFCRQVQNDPLTETLPIILLVGPSAGEQKSAALQAGATDILTKPVDPIELRARVRAALRLKFLADLLTTRGQLDSATGLWNHTFFESRLAEEISLSKRTGRPLSCLVLKLANLQRLNEQHGQPVSAHVFAHFAGIVGANIRQEDVACRTGPDEVSLILPNTPIGGALAQADRLHRSLVSTAIDSAGGRVAINVTIGAAQWNDTDARKLHAIARSAIQSMPPVAARKARAATSAPQQRVA